MIEENPDYALQKLVFAYARPIQKPVYDVVFAVDSLCADIVMTTSETLIGQMRLAWWRDIIGKGVDQRPNGHPLIAKFNAIEGQLNGEALTGLINIWEGLLCADDQAAYFDIFHKQRADVMAAALSSSNDKATPEMCLALQLYSQWYILRRTSLITDVSQRDNDWARLVQFYDAHQPALKTLPKPLKILTRLMGNDIKNDNREKDLFRPITALRIIFYGLTS